MPLYSATTAAARTDAAKLTVTVVPAPETPGAYQIDVVVPLALAACEARVQVVPVWVMLDTALVTVLRVEITAIKVLPSVGAVTVTVKELAALPVLPVALFTRVSVPCETACDPTFLLASVALPDNVRFAPSRLFATVRIPDPASYVRS